MSKEGYLCLRYTIDTTVDEGNECFLKSLKLDLVPTWSEFLFNTGPLLRCSEVGGI